MSFLATPLPPRRLRLGLAALLLVLAACQGSPGAAPATGGKARRPAPPAGPTVAATATPAPPEPGAPGSPLPDASPTPGPTPSATPSLQALPSLPPPQVTLAQRLGERLLAVAQVGFAQARTSLVSDRSLLDTGAKRVGLIGNNAGSLITDRGGGILGNNAGGLIGNNSGGLIGNNSGGLIGNNSGGLVGERPAGFRLLQFAEAAAGVSLTPLAGETGVSDRWWVDGRRNLLFTYDGFNAGKGWRLVQFRSGDLPSREEIYKPTTFWSSRVPRSKEKVNTDFAPDGTIARRLAHASEQTDSGAVVHVEVMAAPSSFVREPSTGVAVVFKRFTVDPTKKTGAFEYLYEHLGATETGTLLGVEALDDDKFVLNYADPLGTYDGESVLKDRTGATVYLKRQRTANGRRVRTYDLQDGLEAELTLSETEEDTWRGEAREAGQRVAALQLVTRPNGSMLFTLTFPEAPDEPLEFGYGIQDEPPTTTPAYVEPPPLAEVTTLAGQPTPGFVDGSGALSRFHGLFAIAASQRDPRLFYLTDVQNHRIRTLRLGADGRVTVGTLVGTDEAAYVAGSLAETRLKYPAGLVTAAGPDGGETLYLTELGGVVRRIVLAADGTGESEFLAGTAELGGQDGPGVEATFDHPFGIAHDPVANRLYVVERDPHRLRAIDLSRPDLTVTTLAGGTQGFADGPAATARFDGPTALWLDPDGWLYVADTDNRRLRRLAPREASPVVETVVGDGAEGRGYFDGPALTAGMNPPSALMHHPAGHWLTGAMDVRVYTPASGTLRTLAGGFEDGYEDGDLDAAKFSSVNGFALAPDGSLLVADENRVRRIAPAPGQGPLLR
ncbi:MAG: hypothetical protein VKQ33_11530 [Candidatus Sericytochromatia bacterium]|nr:hypothetical protein [Candidatus Sericytochromatia bacterium]